MQEGVVYAVEFSARSGRDLINMAKKRTNVIRESSFGVISMFLKWRIIPAIVEDARLPNKYRMLLSLVDVIFADIAQPDQARIVIYNAESFLKDGGHVVISIKASCIDSTLPPEALFAAEVQKLIDGSFKPLEQVTLEPYERDHAMVSGASLAFRYLLFGISNRSCSNLPSTRGSNLILIFPVRLAYRRSIAMYYLRSLANPLSIY